MKCLEFSDRLLKITTSSADETRIIGETMGESAYPGLTVLLYGELGMGKTVFSKGFGTALGMSGIKSPSFIIVAEHTDGKFPLTHADLYRLETARQSDALDLEQYTEEGVLVVEWPDRWASAPDEDVWKIYFSRGANENERELTIEHSGVRAAEALRRAAEKITALCGETK